MGSVNNPLDAPVFHELVGGEMHNPGGDASWLDWDITAIVPTGTTYVMVTRCNSSNQSRGVRENGSTDDRRNTGYNGTWIVKCESVGGFRIIEIYCTLDAQGDFNIEGYWA